jgi:hypothetical protein
MPKNVEPFFQESRPCIAVLNMLQNDFHFADTPAMLAQAYGFWNVQNTNNPHKLDRYLAELRSTLRMFQRNGIPVVFIIPEVDHDFYQENPMEIWQEKAAIVAKEEGAVVVGMYDALFRSDFPFVFNEFMHPNRLGYERIAQSVYETLISSWPKIQAELKDRDLASEK